MTAFRVEATRGLLLAAAWSRMSASCPSLLASPSPQRPGKRRRFATGGASSTKAAGSSATFGFLQARPSIIIAQHIVRFGAPFRFTRWEARPANGGGGTISDSPGRRDQLTPFTFDVRMFERKAFCIHV